MTPRLALSTLVFAVALAPAVIAAQPAADRAVPPPVARMQAPAGWNEDARTAVRVEETLAVPGAVFPGATALADAQAWTSSPPGAALIATQATTTTLPADPAAAATAALNDLRAGADAVDGSKVTRWDVKFDSAGKVNEATLEWSEPAIGTTTLARALVYRAGGALVRIGGECILGPDGAAARASCEAALASIAPTAASFELIAAAPTAPTVGEVPPSPHPSSGSDAPGIRPLDGELPSTIAVRPGPKQTDRRPFYVGAGVVLLAVVFWWNRRERDKREAADRAEQERTARRDRKSRKDDEAGDDEAGDDEAGDDEGSEAESSADAIDASAAESADNDVRDAKKTTKLSKRKPSTDEEPS